MNIRQFRQLHRTVAPIVLLPLIDDSINWSSLLIGKKLVCTFQRWIICVGKHRV
jgi:hypothetical protein